MYRERDIDIDIDIYIYIYICVIEYNVYTYVCIYIYIYTHTCCLVCLLLANQDSRAPLILHTGLCEKRTMKHTKTGPRFNPGRCQLHGLRVRHFKFSGGVPPTPEQSQANGRLSESKNNKKNGTYKDNQITNSKETIT